MHFLLVLVLVGLLGVTEADKKHHFKDDEYIPLYVNNVGPYTNPSETYDFYSLPFCKPEKLVKKHLKLGQIIQGDRAVLTDYDLPFKHSFTDQPLCDMDLTDESIEKFKNAIKRLFYFEMNYDDLPLFGFIGTTNDHLENEQPRYYLFKHWNFNFEYNGEQVIRVNISTTEASIHELPNPAPASTATTHLTLTYSASWTETTVPFPARSQFYRDAQFPGQMKIHWLSIANSFVLVLLLTGFLMIVVLRMLRSDYAQYAMLEEDEEPEYGWKQIHGDVFRFPPFKSVFCAFLGIGVQFMSIVVGTLLLSLFGIYYPTNGGNIYASAIALYALTAGFGGYVSGRMYKQFQGERWAWNIVLVAVGLFAVPFACTIVFANGIARHFKVTTALPFVTMLEVFCIWIFVGFPLTVFGGIAGRRFSGEFKAPVRTRSFPREIPAIPWYRTLPCQMIIAGFLPFTAIYIELFYIYNSVWGHNHYTLYGILCLVFIILLVVTACVTVSLTYFQLSLEDHRWWWPAFINGGSTGIFIYLYSIYYYIYHTNMTGLLQGTFFFGYVLVACYFFFILLGTVGFFSSLTFVRRIYVSKVD